VSDTVRACPSCDSSSIERRVGGNLAGPASADWVCECGHEFDAPVEREPNGTVLDGHAKLRRIGRADLIEGGGE